MLRLIARHYSIVATAQRSISSNAGRAARPYFIDPRALMGIGYHCAEADWIANMANDMVVNSANNIDAHSKDILEYTKGHAANLICVGFNSWRTDALHFNYEVYQEGAMAGLPVDRFFDLRATTDTQRAQLNIIQIRLNEAAALGGFYYWTPYVHDAIKLLVDKE
jgi:hypothetical protein